MLLRVLFKHNSCACVCLYLCRRSQLSPRQMLGICTQELEMIGSYRCGLRLVTAAKTAHRRDNRGRLSSVGSGSCLWHSSAQQNSCKAANVISAWPAFLDVMPRRNVLYSTWSKWSHRPFICVFYVSFWLCANILRSQFVWGDRNYVLF
jgi:hypothetical protein